MKAGQWLPQNHSPCVYYLQYLLELTPLWALISFSHLLRIKFVVQGRLFATVTASRPGKLCSWDYSLLLVQVLGSCMCFHSMRPSSRVNWNAFLRMIWISSCQRCSKACVCTILPSLSNIVLSFSSKFWCFFGSLQCVKPDIVIEVTQFL